MKIWAVANQKGGVGKTTTAVTLAGILTSQGQPTLLLDLDPHGSMSSYFGLDPDSEEISVYTLFEQAVANQQYDARRVVRDTGFDHLHLIPASTALVTLDKQLGARNGMGLVVANALNQLAEYYSFVIIDCPPILGVLMVSALAACEQLIIPVQTEFLALKGLERMTGTLTMIERSRKMDIPYRVLPTMFDRRTRASIESLRKLRDRYSQHIGQAVIPIDTQFREASQAGQPLSLMNPKTHGAQAYEAFLMELLSAEQTTDAVVGL